MAKKRLTAFQELVKEKGKFCRGESTKTKVRSKATQYVVKSVITAKKNGEDVTKRKKLAIRNAKRVLAKGCKITSNIAGRKKRATKKRRTKKR